MGVIYVVDEARKRGFWNGNPDWCNLGQGQPEIGNLDGAPPRFNFLTIGTADHAYGPVNGIDGLRDAVAAHYNRLYRNGKKSKYSRANVSIGSGGRLVLSRIFACLGTGKIGYQSPDYTAYEDLIDYHRHRFEPVHVPTNEQSEFVTSSGNLERIFSEQDLSAFLLSNPCNPTGQVVKGEELRRYVDAARCNNCHIIFDEFYSQFLYTPDGSPASAPVSAARYIDDVESDPIIIVDGLTKGFRYPSWRVGWAIGPSELIENIGRAASAIDGGPSIPTQRAAIEILEPVRADQECQAVRAAFAAKRNLMKRRLAEMGIATAGKCEGTFYLWATLKALPPPLNQAEEFFFRALDHKVMTVPGPFFDINPGKLRPGPSPYTDWMRFSYGPSYENVCLGLDRLNEMIAGTN